MELLYIWIEDYKNIHHQGFNFSPQYRFEFEPKVDTLKDDKSRKNENEKKKVTGGELFQIDRNGNRITKKEKESNIDKPVSENFFQSSQEIKGEIGMITNVTAVVGSNGAGKSNLLEFIKTKANGNIERHTFFFLYKNNKDFIIRKGKNLDITNSTAFKIKNLTKEKYSKTIPFDHTIERVIKKKHIEFAIKIEKDKLIRLPFEIPNTIELSFLGAGVFLNFGNGDIFQPLIHKSDSIDEIEIDRDYKMDKVIINFLFPDFMYTDNNNHTERLLKIQNLTEQERFQYCILENIFINFYYYLFYYLPKVKKKKNNFLNETINHFKESIKLNNDYTTNKKRAILTFFKKTSKWIEQHQSNLKASDFYELDGKSMINEFKELKNSYEIIANILNEINNLVFQEYQVKQNIYSESPFIIENKNANIVIDLLDKISINKLKVNYSLDWHGLSYGEIAFIILFSHFDFSVLPENNFLLILIDEGESGFHPEWQRKYLKYLIDFFPQIYPNKQMQIILTTHSPFLVSDLPKENVIFLRKGNEGEKLPDGTDANGKCILINGFKDKKQTFGANIHTLLSDSFFLQGGLTGEFATGKIQEVIDYLNDPKKRIIGKDKEKQVIIDMIGEPILKRQLQLMMDSKRLQKVEDHESRIKRLENKIKSLKNRNSK